MIEQTITTDSREEFILLGHAINSVLPSGIICLSGDEDSGKSLLALAAYSHHEGNGMDVLPKTNVHHTIGFLAKERKHVYFGDAMFSLYETHGGDVSKWLDDIFKHPQTKLVFLSHAEGYCDDQPDISRRTNGRIPVQLRVDVTELDVETFTRRNTLASFDPHIAREIKSRFYAIKHLSRPTRPHTDGAMADPAFEGISALYS